MSTSSASASNPHPTGPPRFLCLGSLIPRKNVVRLADAFAQLGEGTLTFVGDGPLRPSSRAGRRRGHGRAPVRRDPRAVAGAHVVCQPSLIEPFGQATLEAMAAGRSVVATRIGGPPEFVPLEAGVLVDPADEAALTEALRTVAGFPCTEPGRAAGGRGARRQASGGEG